MHMMQITMTNSEGKNIDMKKLILSLILIFVFVSETFAAKLPVEWYTVDYDGTVRRGQQKIHAQTKPIEGTNKTWLMVSPSNPEMEGSKRAVWIYDSDNHDKAPLFIPLKKGVECTEITADDSRFYLTLSTGIVAIYDFDGELIDEKPIEETKNENSNSMSENNDDSPF